MGMGTMGRMGAGWGGGRHGHGHNGQDGGRQGRGGGGGVGGGRSRILPYLSKPARSTVYARSTVDSLPPPNIHIHTRAHAHTLTHGFYCMCTWTKPYHLLFRVCRWTKMALSTSGGN